MPKKIRELKKMLKKAGFNQVPGNLANNLNGGNLRNGFGSQRQSY